MSSRPPIPTQKRVAGLSRWHQVLHENGHTVSSMARVFGVSRQTLAKWSSETGKGAPALYLIEFCELFDISLTWLTWGIGPKHLSDFPPNE